MRGNYFGLRILPEESSKNFLGFLLENSLEHGILFLNYYSSVYGIYTHTRICEVPTQQVVHLVSSSSNGEVLKQYIAGILPIDYQNKKQTFYIDPNAMAYIIDESNCYLGNCIPQDDVPEQEDSYTDDFPDYEEDPFPDEDIEFEGDADFMFDD